jgi:hypothetical protein
VVFVLQDRHRDVLEERVDRHFDFTDSIDRSISIDTSSPCLVVTPSAGVVAIGQIRRSQSFTAVGRRIRISRVQMVGPWAIARISRRMPAAYRRWFGTTGETRQLPAATWSHAVEAIRALDSEAADFLLNQAIPESVSPELDTQREERDAVLLCMDLAGLDRSRVGSLPLRIGTHFLDGAETVGLLEERMVGHDALAALPGWDRDIDPSHAYAFTDASGERLTIMNVGGDRPETKLGVDLIYWRQEPNAFVLVQYKRLLKDGSTWRYWPSSDPNFKKEIDRMHSVLQAIGALPAPAEVHSDFRLMANPFFFKFCPAIQGTRRPEELIKGMYVPLRFWELLEADGVLTGPKGGVSITHQSAPRWINNTLFADLVADAWVGTAGGASQFITDLIRSSLGLGKAVIVGVEHPGRRRLGRRLDSDPFD